MIIIIPNKISDGCYEFDPLKAESTESVNLEITSRCNLRCTYCSCSQPEYKGIDMPWKLANYLITELKKRDVQMLCLNGHGETTIIPGWHELCQPHIDTFNMSIISNFSRLFSMEELDVLSHFSTVNISLDTADASLLKQIRRKADLQTIVKNIKNLQDMAHKKKRPCPELYIFCTIYDKNVFHLEDFSRLVTSLGVTGVMFGQLIKHPDIINGENVDILTSLSKAKQKQALDKIDSSLRILSKEGVVVGFWGDHIEVIRRQLSDVEEKEEQSCEKEIQKKRKLRKLGNLDWEKSIIDLCSPDQTRDCFDPWTYAHIDASGGVIPCCIGDPIGKVTISDSLHDTLNNSKIRKLRKNLLLGQLDSKCSVCPVRIPISKSDFRRKYSNKFKTPIQLNSSLYNKLFFILTNDVRLIPARGMKKWILKCVQRFMPKKMLLKIISYFNQPVPPELAGFIQLKNVKMNNFRLEDRIYLHPNAGNASPATILFKNIPIKKCNIIDLHIYLDNDKSKAVKFELSIIDLQNGDEIEKADTILKERKKQWIVEVAELDGDYDIVIRIRMAKKTDTSQYAWTFLDYPMVYHS